MQTRYSIFADSILVLHVAIVLFNVGALPVIWLGYFRGWQFVRSFSFRVTHLLLIGFIAAESLLGAICPLTTWEDKLRRQAGAEGRYQGGFIAHWLHELIFYDLSENVFAIGYGVFFALVLFTFFRVRPRRPKWWARGPETREP